MSEIKYAAVRHWHSQGLSIAEIIAKCASNGIKSKHGTLPGKTTIHDWIHGRTIESQSDTEQDSVEDLFTHSSVDGERFLQSPNREHNFRLILSWHRRGLTTSDIVARCRKHKFLNRSWKQPSPQTIKYWIRKAEEFAQVTGLNWRIKAEEIIRANPALPALKPYSSTTEELDSSTTEELTEDDQGTYQERIKYLERMVKSLIDGFSNLVDAHCVLVDDFKTLNNRRG